MMSVSSKSLHHHSSALSSEDSAVKQGIVAILGSDSQTNKSASSIRRTISADIMSSKKWLPQNGFFSPMKRIVVDSSSSSSFLSELQAAEGEEDSDKVRGQDELWWSIQSNKKERNEVRKPVDVWASILTQKSENPHSDLAPVYIHPLMKSSASSLTEKSLEICTESLGSETGSDVFSDSSDISSEAGDQENNNSSKEDGQREEEFKEWQFPSSGDFHVPKYKKSPVRPLPPPLPSIAGSYGSSLHMQSHRKNGRLVLEAVSVPSTNYFHAQRRDGRLVLSLIHNPAPENEIEVFFEAVMPDQKMDVEEEEKAKQMEIVMEQNLRSSPGRMIRVHKSALVMKNPPPTWPNKFKKVTSNPTGGGLVSFFNNAGRRLGEVEEDLPIPQSIPSPPPLAVARLIPPPAAAASFNAYEYFWRNQTPAPRLKHLKISKNKKFNEHQHMVLVRRGDEVDEEDIVLYLQGCKERRRSLLIEELCCIATS